MDGMSEKVNKGGSSVFDFVTYRVRTECRLCGSGELHEAMQLHATPLGDRYLPPGRGANNARLVPLEIVQCEVCDNFQTSCVVEASDIYESYLSRPGAVNTELSSAYSRYAEDLEVLSGICLGDLVVELGSNDGLFASFFAAKGFRCLGVDPAVNLAETARSRGVETVSNFFSAALAHELVKAHGTAKVVVANFMVANVDDLDDFMSGVSTILDAKGVFGMETNYVCDVVQHELIETLNHEHLNYFSIASLNRFFGKHGLELFDVERVPSKGGSIRCFVQHKGAEHTVTKAVADALLFERSQGVATAGSWERFAQSLKHARRSVISFCSQQEPQSIVGYGTSIGATTLIYQLGLGPYLNLLVDDDPFRQGLESPGFGIPTVGPEVAFQGIDKASACVVLAPQYVNQIVEKNTSARNAGVDFYRVWPHLELAPKGEWWR